MTNTTYKLITGPFIGEIVDDGGLWINRLECASFESADQDLQSRFKDWVEEHPGQDWEAWISSWESEEVE